MRKCVVNFADTAYYQRGQKMITESFIKGGYDGDFMFFRGLEQLPGCPAHGQVPYAFKPYSIKQAMDKNYDLIIWVDSFIYLRGKLSDMYDDIRKYGYFLVLNGWTTGQWCSDNALVSLGITREESFKMPHIMACVMGFDTRYAIVRKFLDEYYAKSNDGVSFIGDWQNDNHQVSQDDKVLGHRHDQTAASVIAWKLGMREWKKFAVSYEPDDKNPDIIFINHPPK